MRIPNKPA